MPNFLFNLVGPTATGKSAIALSLAKHLPIEIISMDSAMVYKEMDIGTAKPSLVDRELVPHHLIDILPISETFSAGDFFYKVNELVPAIWQRKRIPLLVGGTMMYFFLIKQGMASLPTRNLELRKQLAIKKEQAGLEVLYADLLQIDQKYGEKISPNDWKRIERGLEIYYSTNRKPSEVVNNVKKLPFSMINFYLTTSLEKLRDRIAKRLDQMLEGGLIQEVEYLIAERGAQKDSVAMQNIGYKQIFPYLNNEINFSTMREEIFYATAHLAKHQLTWLKKWKEEAFWFNVEEGPLNLIKQIEQIIRQKVCGALD